MTNYEIVDHEDGSQLAVRSDGQAIPSAFLDLILELNKQNPSFYAVWVSLAEEYVFSGATTMEA